jgi:phage-related minor tail protein
MTATNRGAGAAGFPGQYVLQYDSTNYLMQIAASTAAMVVTLNNLAFGQYSMLIRGFGPGQTVPVSFTRDNGQFFAAGAAFTNGIVSSPTSFGIGTMGEAGPEAIMPLSNVGGSLGVRARMPGADGMVDELRGLREEVAMLRAEARATAINTGRTQDIMKRITKNGESMIVSTDGEALEVTAP